MKWGKAMGKPPTEWLAAYPEAAFALVNKENYLEFVAADSPDNHDILLGDGSVPTCYDCFHSLPDESFVNNMAQSLARMATAGQ